MRRTWIHQLLRRIIASQPSSRNGRRHSARPQVETLEGRCIPSVNVFLSGRALIAQGDNNGNFIELDHGGSTTVLAGVAVNEASFDSIVINSGNGNDNVLVTGTAKPTTINTGGGTDTVNLGAPVNVLDMRAPITVNGQGGGVKTLHYNDQANGTPALTYTLSATGTAGRVQRNGLADVTYGGIANLTVNTGTIGNQTVNVLSTAFPTSTTVNGGRGNNTFIVGDSSNRLQTTGLLTINGGSGQNLLSFRDMGTTVPATYAITPTFVNRPLGGAVATLYSHITTLVVSGGSGGNTFFVDSLASGTATFIAAGAGNNTINVGSGQVFDQGRLTVIGGPLGFDQLFLNDQATPTPVTYALTGSAFSRNGADTTVSYSGVARMTLKAGGGGNTITVADMGNVAATVNTGAGGDAVTVFGFQASPVAVSDPSGSGTIVVDDSFQSGPQSYSVTAGVLNRIDTRSISYTGLGSVQLLTSQGADTVFLNSTAAGTDTQVFTSSNGNTFRMGTGPFAGTLELNGSGTDKLDYSAFNFVTDVYVNLQTGEATDLTAFSGIRDVTGGQGNNILVGDGHGNTLTGGNRRNLLIAGGSDFSGQGDTLIGGSDEDILIAGFTDYDLDKDSLLAIMAAWTGSGFYADRVAALTTGNGVPLLDATTVHSNGGNNVLLGNAGFDLFFANANTDRTDADPEAEVVVAIS